MLRCQIRGGYALLNKMIYDKGVDYTIALTTFTTTAGGNILYVLK